MPTATKPTLSAFAHLEPASYAPHPLHREGRTYLETNCYVDVLIELLHARGAEPLAMLGSIVRTAWEGDQFTYAKPRQSDLERLYGLDIHEMLPYRPVPEHIEEQLWLERTLLIEIDGFYLPDTAGTSYQREHLKTTIAPVAIDREAQTLRYFHNAGFFDLAGEDYCGAFRLLPHFTDDVMDPFVELVSFDHLLPRDDVRLRELARELLGEHLRMRPERNPFLAWGERLGEDLARLGAGADEDYHRYAFVTVRMVGSAFELLADHLAWVLESAATPAVGAAGEIVAATKTLSFRLARRRPFDPAPAIERLAAGWEACMDALRELLG